MSEIPHLIKIRFHICHASVFSSAVHLHTSTQDHIRDKKKKKKRQWKQQQNELWINRSYSTLKVHTGCWAIWGCMKTTTKDKAIHSAMDVPACTAYVSVRCRLSSIGFKFPKSILGLPISPFIDRRRIGKHFSTELQWTLLWVIHFIMPLSWCMWIQSRCTVKNDLHAKPGW